MPTDPTLRTLPPADVLGIDALIAELDRRVRDSGNYTSREASEFVRRWRDARAKVT